MRTIGVAGPTIGKVIFGILPITVGSALLGMTIFYDYKEAFGNFDSSIYTLIALQCGDMVYDFYVATTDCSLIFGELFSYLFVFFAVSCVQSICMVIVEDSYIQVKYKKNYEWLQGDEANEQN